MRKLGIFLITSSLVLTSCATTVTDFGEIAQIEETEFTETVGNRNTYVSAEMKDTVEKINDLAGKYKEEIDRGDFGPVYIDIYESDNIEGSIQDVFSMDNANYNYSKEYFNDVVEILDENISIGLKNFVQEASEMELQPEEQIIEKIGKTVVHVERDIGRGRNYIGISTRLTDAKDEDYRDLLQRISKDNYILDNIYTEGLGYEDKNHSQVHNLISFVNPEVLVNRHVSSSARVRYEVLLKDKNIEKVNLLLSRKADEELREEDIDVFVNLLDYLKIEEEKGELVKRYKNIFEERKDKISLDTSDYNIKVLKGKGNNYIGERRENIYISIEEK